MLLKPILYLWASPNTILGITFGLVALLSGGKVQIRQRCIEFYGGWLSSILKRLPPKGVSAMTLGHSILGMDRISLDRCRKHEQVHVRQYERWGIAFIPAYLLCSLVLWLQKKDYYYENPFEVEAYSKEER